MDAEISLVPFIDLLLCCIMFLLVTAVWNQLATLQAEQSLPGDTADAVHSPPDPHLVLQLTHGGYVLSSTYGDRVELADDEQLVQHLDQRRAAHPSLDRVVVAPEDGIPFEAMVAAMDLLSGAGYRQLSLSDGATL